MAPKWILNRIPLRMLLLVRCRLQPVLSCAAISPCFVNQAVLRFHGLIGLEFLKSWIITIDFDEGRVDVLSPDTERNPDWGERIPAVYDRRGILFIPATAGKASWSPFMLDTGCNDTGLLDSTLLTRLADAHEVRVFGDDKGVSLSGISSSRIVRLSMLSVGSFRHENLRFVTGTQNVLGLKYLSRYRVTIDIAHECLYLVKGKHSRARQRAHFRDRSPFGQV